MGVIEVPQKTKFFCGLLSLGKFPIESVLARLEELWGAIEAVQGPLAFSFTDYYYPEMGGPLLRRFVSFKPLFDREELVNRKLQAMRIEEESSEEGKRRINIDPGYLTLGQLILSTTKDRDQRIYLGQGIFAEVTLRYSKHQYHTYPWTYRDYASPEYQQIFLRMREELKKKL